MRQGESFCAVDSEGTVYNAVISEIDRKELVAETDYTVSLDKSPIKDMGDSTLTIAAKDGGVYTGSKTVSFTG